MMDLTLGMTLVVHGAILVAAGLGALDLARRGGFRPAEIGMALVALGQLSSAGGTPGWGGLLQTGAAAVVMYTLWQMGRLVVGVREPHPLAPSPSRERGNAGVRERLNAPPLQPSPSRERGNAEGRVRAVASWPGRRR